jgi:hypothetical protein
MGKDSGRNTAVYNKALKCGNFIAGAGLNETVVTDVLLDASWRNGLVQDDGERSVLASIHSGIKNGRVHPRAVPEPREQYENFDPPKTSANGSAPPPPDWEEDFWAARPVLAHILNFARARRVGPWALLGCVLVRAVGSVTPDLTLPPLVGSAASLNTFVGIVSMSGGGKGAAESAALEAVDLAHIPTYGPGSGEAIGHLFYVWDKKAEELRQHTVSAILSAPEIDTLTALKTRQASTLFPELRKAWMGEPLGFAYVDREKRLTIPRHSYRLCLITGIQPGNAAPILEDHSSGTPQRLLWMPADDPGAPDERPDDPAPTPTRSARSTTGPGARCASAKPHEPRSTPRESVTCGATPQTRSTGTRSSRGSRSRRGWRFLMGGQTRSPTRIGNLRASSTPSPTGPGNK